MKHEVLKFLEDIRLSIEIIQQHMAPIPSLEKYSSDLKTADAVERRLAIIGEALFQANKLQKDLSVTDKNKIIGLRHILVHDYDFINDATIWTIVETDLPVLMTEVVAQLNKHTNE